MSSVSRDRTGLGGLVLCVGTWLVGATGCSSQPLAPEELTATQTSAQQAPTSCPLPTTNSLGQTVWTFTVRNTTLTLTVDTNTSTTSLSVVMAGSRTLTIQSNALTGDESIVETMGQGSQGLDLFVHDGVMTGTVDGQAIAPVTSSTQQVTLADGSPLPNFPDTPWPADAQAALQLAETCIASVDPPACFPQLVTCEEGFLTCLFSFSCPIGLNYRICLSEELTHDLQCSTQATACFGGIPEVGGGCCDPSESTTSCCDGSTCLSGPPPGHICARGSSGHCVHCPNPGDACRSDAECCAGEICPSGSCVTCPNFGGTCESNAQCCPGEVCGLGLSGVGGSCCVPPEGKCTGSGQCCTGAVCSTTRGVCEEPSGDFQILLSTESGAVLFEEPDNSDPIALNEGQLLDAPFAPIASEAVKYTDNFSTIGSQTEIVVTARDPAEQHATLASIWGPGSIITINGSGQLIAGTWPDNTVAPGDPIPVGAPSGVSLPNGYSIPYPLVSAGSPLTLPLQLGYFTGSNSTQLAGNASLPPGVKGAYLFERGVCSADIDLYDAILNPIANQAPQTALNGIETCNGALGGLCQIFVGLGASSLSVGVDVASFIDRDSLVTPYGGFVMLFNSLTNYDLGALNSAQVSFNYTYRFGLSTTDAQGSPGILTTSVTRNGEYDTGAFSQTIDNGLEGAVPKTISDQVFLGALAQQAHGVPANIAHYLEPNMKLPPECSGPIQPHYCYAPCQSVPALRPPPPTTGYDDPSWYDISYCGTAPPDAPGNDVADNLDAAVTLEAGIVGISGQGAGELGATMRAVRSQNTSELANVRCNFWPSYESDYPCTFGGPFPNCPNGPPVPVCEVVARAKRLNVLPDKVELVWFDGPDLSLIRGNTFQPEFNNEALALYVLLTATNGTHQLCQRQEEFSPFSRVFAHATGSASD